MTIQTQTQHRATCPICFRDHAVRSLKNARMVQHGYQRPEGWHQNVNECSGTSNFHFGTPEGREVAAANAAFIRSYAQTRRDDAAALGSTPPASIIIDGKYLGCGKGHEQLSIDATDHRFAHAIEVRIANALTQARHADQTAAEIERRVAEWTPIAPRAVEVETGVTLHALNAYYSKKTGRDEALCGSGSRFSGRSSFKVTTTDNSKVTCKACLKSLAATAASKAIGEQADALIAEMVAKHGESTKQMWTPANKAAVSELRYKRKEIDKAVRQRACERLERGGLK